MSEEAPRPYVAASADADDAGDAALATTLAERYAPPTVPPCRVCGAPLAIASMGGGRPTVYVCSAVASKHPMLPGDWEHCEASRWDDYRQGGDQQVLDAVRRFTERRRVLQGVESMLEETLDVFGEFASQYACGCGHPHCNNCRRDALAAPLLQRLRAALARVRESVHGKPAEGTA